MSKVTNYLKSKGPWWYISNTLLALIICILLIPSWRQGFSVFIMRLSQGSPALETKSIDIPEATYQWEILDIGEAEWFKFERTKGKVVFLNYWATWCGPCVAEMKSIQELYNRYEEDVDFIMISKEEIKKIDGFKKYHNYTLPFHTIANSPEIFATNKLPTTYIINKSGQIVVKEFGAHDWNEQRVTDLLDELINE